MLEFKLSPWDAKIIKHEQEIMDGIKERFGSLLEVGGRITPEGKILGEQEVQTDSFTISPKTNSSLGYWFDRGKINISVGDEIFEPIFAFANYVKSALEKGELYNRRIKTQKLTSLLLIEIADREGVGRIKNPNRKALSAA